MYYLNLFLSKFNCILCLIFKFFFNKLLLISKIHLNDIFFYIGKTCTEYKYFWADRIKNILKLYPNSVKKIRIKIRIRIKIKISEAKNCYFLKNAQPGLEKCGSYKKKV